VDGAAGLFFNQKTQLIGVVLNSPSFRYVVAIAAAEQDPVRVTREADRGLAGIHVDSSAEASRENPGYCYCAVGGKKLYLADDTGNVRHLRWIPATG
jgi:hypothetical protein